MRTRTNNLPLSPSLHHRYLMDHQRPALAYRGGDVAVWQRKLRRKLRERLGYGNEVRCALRTRKLAEFAHPLGTN